MENKKKRGRKPKEKTIINDNPIFADDKDNIDDLIIKLNSNQNDNNLTYELNEFNKQNLVGENNISEVCWNCCHCFHNDIVGLPIKYNNNIFSVIGDFCSLECAARYAYDNYKDDIHELFNLINLYNNIKYNKIDKIKMAQPKLTLKKFGGNLDINEYRKNKDYYDVNLPIIIPVNMNINKHETINNNLSEFKIYRKNDINKNNKLIFSKLCQLNTGL